MASTKPETTLRVLTMKDLVPATASIAEAFADDHFSHYFLDSTIPPSHPRNAALHLQIMTAVTASHLLRGLVTAAGPASDPYACIALWCPPGTHTEGLATSLRSGLWRLRFRLSREARVRMFTETFPLQMRTKAAVLGPRDTDSWYLVYIGTRPSGRGLGLARKSIEYVTRQADAARKACYLESSSAMNSSIYGRLGFTSKCEIALQRDVLAGLVKLEIMVREPAGGASKVEAGGTATSSGRMSVHESLDGLSSVDSTETVDDKIRSGISRLNTVSKVPAAIPEKELIAGPTALAGTTAVVA